MSQPRLQSGKVDRHNSAIKKYQNYENSKINQVKLDDMIKGQKSTPMIPKAGQFLCVASDKPLDQLGYLDIPLHDLLDGTKSFTELKAAANRKKGTKLLSSSQPKRKPKFHQPVLKMNPNEEVFIKEVDEDSVYNELGVEPTTEPQFTKNIREIVRRQHKQLLSPTNVVIRSALEEREGETQNDSKPILPQLEERIIQSANQSKPSRPISGKYILKALKIDRTETLENSKGLQTTQAKEKRQQLKSAKPRNFYVPQHEEADQVKHIMGYQIIKLTSKDFIQTFDEEYKKEKERKMLENHFKTSAVDPRLQSPYIKTNFEARKKILEAQEQNGELELTKKRKRMFMSEPDNGNGTFLPLDYYYIEDESGLELIQKYSDPKTSKCFGYSKWFQNSGEYEWLEVEVLGYNQQEDKFLIKWLKMNKQKLVTRVNLRFQLEDEEIFRQQLQVAEYYRKQSEIFIKYNYMIDMMEDKTSILSEEVLARIQYFMLGFQFKIRQLRDCIQFFSMEPSIKFNFKRNLVPQLIQTNNKTIIELLKERKYKIIEVEQLLQEIRNHFIRTNHQISFNYALPYSEEKQKLFKGYLPDKMFMTSQEIRAMQTPSYFPDYGISPNTFIELFKSMNKILHQANPKKMSSLQQCQIQLLKFEESYLFANQFLAYFYFYNYIMNRPIDIIDMQKQQNHRCLDVVRDFKQRMYDIHFEIMDMVEAEVKVLKVIEEERLRLIVLEAERRQAQEQGLQSENLSLLKQFQKLINTKFERAMCNCWMRSISNFNGYFEKVIKKFEEINHSKSSEIIQFGQVYNYAWDLEFKEFEDDLLLKVEVIIKQDKYQIELDPSPEQWRLLLTDSISNVLRELTSIQCMRTREIGSAREDQLVHIFQDLSDSVVVEPKKRFSWLLNRTFQMLQLYFEKLQEFEFLLDYQPEKKLKKGHQEDFARELDKLKQAKDDIDKYLFKKQIRVGIFWLDVEQYLSKCQTKIKEATNNLYDMLIKKIAKENAKLEDEIKDIINKLVEDPKDIERLHALRTYANDELGNDLATINAKINKVMEKMTLMEKMHYKISYENFSKSWSIYGMPLKLLRKKEKCIKRLQGLERRFQDDLTSQQIELAGQIMLISQDLDQLMMEHDISKIDEIANKFLNLEEKIDKAKEESEIVNRREAILKWKITDYNEIEKIKKLFAPYSKVWILGRDYNYKIPQAMTGALGSIDRDQLTTEVIDSWNELFKLEKNTFKLIPHMLLVTTEVRKLYESFKPYLPVINDLRNPALKKRHLTKFKQFLPNVELDEDLVVPFQVLLDNEIMNFKEEIRDISEIATKEQGFEKIINKMKSEWRNVKFELTIFRDTGAYILKGVEPILDRLDEDIAKTQTIATSPFVTYFQQLFNQIIHYNQIEKSIHGEQPFTVYKKQQNYGYLQPIFFSDDIVREMPTFGTKYQVVDRMWRGIMQTTHMVPLVMEACFQTRLKENFQMMIEQLDQVIKGLNEFLNRKRSAFPRFYFLSNEELLQILAQAREPRAVQKHLQKCFEGIDYLTFEDNLLITYMSSNMKEKIKLITDINPLANDGSVRGVEEWLFDVQQSMKSTLKILFPKCVEQVASTPLAKIIIDQPAQLLITSHEIHFTSQMTNAIIQFETKPNSLADAAQYAVNTLLATVKILHLGNLTPTQAIALGVLIVLQVKQKDIATDLSDKSVSSQDHFDWISQMRYYLGQKGEIIVKMLHTARIYGYEYLGNQSRLVITPLTDRCYRTLMAALHMYLGGAPEGPAGTGKTETTKDLAKALAKHCVVFNCSDQLDYLAMAKFFKGLVSCGSWACFDEFNRIELEVLSVIAQQILQIQTAIIRESNSKVPIKQFTFEGTSLTLDSSCAIFITMNPGYQGRSELPDNLKALFRSVAMMIPNYAMITEISLYSYGFQKARELSIKITTSLKLASEQLSTQSHYDFGMRAVKSIILAAGQLKRAAQEGDDDEEILALRAIEDCNLPKFTRKDVPLFQAIISDLFPTIQPKARNYGSLGEAIKQVLENKSYVCNDGFFQKIIQLYETINVRHGLMVVGGTISGKTTIIETLGKSLEKFEQTGPVKMYPINPKSITPKLLYGDVDEATSEWQDGITAVIFRECIEGEELLRKWVIFDGPVDALWIENMNTVLDDNKKLCLANGETIKLTDSMRIIFEVEDLLEASPATVSRCGMVYLEPQEIGWKSLFRPWYSNLTPNFNNEFYEEYFKWLYIDIYGSAIEFLQKARSMHPYSTEWLAMNTLKLFFALLLKQKTKKQVLQDIELEKEKEVAKQKALKLEGKEIQIQQKKIVPLNEKERTEYGALFMVSVVWSVGSLLDSDQRGGFHEWAIKQLGRIPNCSKEIIPSDKSKIFEIMFDQERKNWNLWNTKIDYRVPKEIQFHEIYIPTTESLQNHGLLRILVLHDYPLIFYGRTGTGKTLVAKRFLLDDLDLGVYLPTITAFSANTSCTQVLDILEQKLEKQKRRKGVYGPLIGTTNIIFIDDMNMPKKEQYGAQPPLEIIRQWFSQGGWYDKKTLEKKQIIDIMFCGAMGVGRPNISQRLVRHFNMIFLPEMEEETLKTIIRKICDWGFNDYVDKVKFATKNIDLISLAIYKKIQQQFLPLPKKSHYLFNLRDILKVVQGILSVPNTKYDANSDVRTQILKLWVYEHMCVFSDRFVDDQDQQLLKEILNETLELEFNIKITELLVPSQPIRNYDDQSPEIKLPNNVLYGNFMEPHSQSKCYQELIDYNKIINVIQEYLLEFNQFYPKIKMDLVLFDDAIQFLCKINRIISQPFGNALLVGLGGTGCRSLSRLAAFMQDFSIGELEESSEWYDFLREMLKQVGLKSQSTVFILPDAQIYNERYLEDVNNILNIGEIPNLYPPDDKEALISDVQAMTEKERLGLKPLQLWEYFVKKCRMNLHIILYLSPIGDKFKERIRNFPSLVSCTSTIWIKPWSQEALREVAVHFLEQQQQDEDEEETTPIQAIANVCVKLHHSVQLMTEIYRNETGKHYYVTPLSYMKMLKSFMRVYVDKKEQKEHQRDTYINGVKMLDECGVIVENMSVELTSLQPILVQKTQETEEIMRKVEIETTEAEKQRVVVQQDEKITQGKAEIAAKIQESCKERLSEAEPQLEEALNALKTLKIQDFVEMKSFSNPPKLIRLTMDAVCIMMDRKPKKAADGSDDYWEEAKKLLADPQKFIKSLEKYNRNNIPEKVIQKMTSFLAANKTFTPQTILKASQAAEGLCKWCIAIFKYYHVYKAIQPLREDLEKANQSLKEASDELAKKQKMLQDVEDKCKALREKFENENFQKQKLKAQITDCEIKMRRAMELTGGLSGEKTRWKDEGESLQKAIQSLLGDMLLSVGFLSYMGAFTSEYRTRIIMQNWLPAIFQNNIPSSGEQFSLVFCLSSQLEVQEFILNGLPLDDVSKENSIIMKYSESYPLIIDPQAQANKFIQRQIKQLVIAKPGRQFNNLLEKCLRMGETIMLQNVGETLDPILDPILSKQYQIINMRPLVSLNGNLVDVHPSFNIFLVTSLANPHYTPQILTKVTLINFTITPEALKDQMTSILVREEEPQLEEEKIRIMNDNNEYKLKMKSIEQSILAMLASTDGAKMLEDEKLIISLQESKVTSEEITQRLKEAKTTEERIYQNRLNYDMLAKFASNGYFTILRLNKLDIMYQFSLEFYVRIFKKAIRQADKPPLKNIKQRVNYITESLKKTIFLEISRSIFVKHKNIFAFMLLITWLDSIGQLRLAELQFLLNGLPQGLYETIPNPNEKYSTFIQIILSFSFFSSNQWQILLHLQSLPIFNGICSSIANFFDQWQDFFIEPKLNQPPDQFSNLSKFSQLLLIRSARPELFGQCMRSLIEDELGSYFVQNLIVSLESSYQDSSITIPLIFLLQPGDDPQDEVKKIAQDKSRNLQFVSLGKGQGEAAEKTILECLGAGQWVILQNCHLAVSWLPSLEALLERINQEIIKKDKERDMKIDTDFRLWLTTMTSDQFPQQLLMNSVKMTKDPPKGVKANILEIYTNQNATKQERGFYNSCDKPAEWKQLYLSLCYFHGVLRERRRYGPVGWNIFYDFNDSDFKISVRQLKQMLQDYSEIPFTALIYLTGECYYGGKVTDDWDRRVMRELLSTFYRMDVFYDNYRFCSVQEYYIPDSNVLDTLEGALEFIQELPDSSTPELFGLHPNASITQAQLETETIINSLIQVGLQSQSNRGQGEDKNKILQERAQELLQQLPQVFDLVYVGVKYKLEYFESMNTVLLQELLRYNTLLLMLSNSLNQLIKATQGLIVMTAEMDKIGESLLNNMVPAAWKAKSYPSLKPLMNYFKDLNERVAMFNRWIKNGAPTVFWVSGFYFTQSFFTGVLQNYARKKKIPIDQLKFEFFVMKVSKEFLIVPEDGVYIDGLFLESGRWNQEENSLDEPVTNIIYQNMPIVIIWLKPLKQEGNQQQQSDDIYICPVYKTTERKGTLSTTGHSTNFILSINLRTIKPSSHWVKRGTALISQLNE